MRQGKTKPRENVSNGGVDLAERRREKRRAHIRIWLYRSLWALGALGLAGLLSWAVLASPMLALDSEEIVVEGAQSVDTARVQTVVKSYAGTPLVRLPVGRIQDEIIALPPIASATINRNWPSGVTVIVEPRKPVLAVISGDQFELLGADGVTVSTAREVPEGIPKVRLDAMGAEESKGVGGSENQERRLRQAQEAYEVWSHLSEGLKDQLSVLVVSGSFVSLEMLDGSTVIWGDASDSELKAKVVEILRRDRPATIYNVEDPAHPTTR